MKKLSFILFFFLTFSIYSQTTYILKTTRNLPTLKITKYLKLTEDNKIQPIFEELNLYSVEISNSKKEILNRISNSEIVEYIVPDQKVEYRAVPNDKFFDKQYGLEQIKATKVWDFNTGGLSGTGEEIVVAVLDKGMEITHDDLKENIWSNPGEIPDDGIDNDDNGYVDDYLGVDLNKKNDEHEIHYHGTSVAGIIGAKGNNSIGISGVNWNVKILPVTGVGTVSQVIKGYNYVYELRKKYNETKGKQGAFIVSTNLSAGLKNSFPEDKKEYSDWCKIYDKLGEEGILNITSAVNDPVDVEVVGDMPTLCKSNYLITVTSTTKNGVFDSDRGYGKTSVDIAAPGRDIYSININNGYKNNFTGNSAAAPFVAGAIGLLYTVPCKGFTDRVSANPAELSLTVKDYLMQYGNKDNSLKEKTKSGVRMDIYNTYIKLSDLCGDVVHKGKFGIIKITPNPSFDEFVTIEYDTDNYDEHSISVSDRIGRIVYTKKFVPNIFGKREIKINVSGYATGIYYATIYSKKKKSTRAFFVY